MTSDRTPTIAVAPLASEFNAFNGLFAEALRQAGVRPVEYQWGLKALARCDAVIFHWPEQSFNGSDWLWSLKQLVRIALLKRTRGLKVVWIAHNALPHDRSEGRSLVGRAFMRSLDGVIYLSARSRELVREVHRLPGGVVEQVTVHGRYSAPSLSFTPPRPDERVRLASIGLIRPYKNLGELIDAARGLDPADVEVAIIGKRHDADYAAALEAQAAANPALRLGFSDDLVSQSDLDAAIDAAHGIVLPYRKILNSGAAILALSRARPVLVPATGSMPELADLVGHDWVRLYEGEISAKVLEDFAAHLRAMPQGATPDLSPLAWERVTDDLRLFLDRLF